MRDKLAEAFQAVADAEQARGDISQLVETLDQAIRLLEEDRLGEAEAKIDTVLEQAPKVKQQGIAATRHIQWTATATIILLAVSAVTVWIYGPRVFWRLWLRIKKDWRVSS